ncbi:glycosyl hydrolase 5 family protein-like isoform X2 [Zingiber officinale]|uniref:glycosyl hydrolase 5 family protein-like isoform X2 n=1 Tax=Zingiber officinale TaxID=94328 RepID=UPI001C4D7E0F|nr:glycosyl hydrolase 5 family protein-like isoform X2 [Zingiber officinale]
MTRTINWLSSSSSQRNHQSGSMVAASATNCLLLLLFLFSFFLLPCTPASSGADIGFPLSTSSRWVVDGAGRRVKLACANWAAHLEPAVAEGLSKQPLDAISRSVAAMGFNCVRLTWPLFLLTDPSLASLTVRRSLDGLGLFESTAGVRVNNPALLDLTLLQAFQAVVSNLASNKLMVILDNQISKPGWCCSRYDGNGFFGDKYFDPDEWLKGLEMMATIFNGSSSVVGMSLRNELRGPKQNISLWYRYMQRGAEIVHSANPNILVILSGLDYDKDLSFLSRNQVDLSFKGKLVFEYHWYGFSDGGNWTADNPNQVCAMVIGNITRKVGFLLEQGWPLFLSEFGVDQSGANEVDNRFLNCFLSYAAEKDIDWAIWALQGSYYVREGQLGFDETYGLLSWDWCKPRNSSFVQRLAAIQYPFLGPGLSKNSPYNVIFHPMTGLCIVMNSQLKQIQLGQCSESEAWSYTRKRKLMLKGTQFCLRAGGVGKPVKLGTSCKDSRSRWEPISDSKLHISSNLTDHGGIMCLDIGDRGVIVTDLCKCLSLDGTCNPDSQWFSIVRSNREGNDVRTQY